MIFRARTLRKFAATLTLLTWLFSQFAVAAYACPAVAAALADEAMEQPCHRDADTTPGALCKAHCESDQKNVTAAKAPPADFVPAFEVTLAAAEPAAFALVVPKHVPLAESPPPLRFVHCVFRI